MAIAAPPGSESKVEPLSVYGVRVSGGPNTGKFIGFQLSRLVDPDEFNVSLVKYTDDGPQNVECTKIIEGDYVIVQPVYLDPHSQYQVTGFVAGDFSDNNHISKAFVTPGNVSAHAQPLHQQTLPPTHEVEDMLNDPKYQEIHKEVVEKVQNKISADENLKNKFKDLDLSLAAAHLNTPYANLDALTAAEWAKEFPPKDFPNLKFDDLSPEKRLELIRLKRELGSMVRDIAIAEYKRKYPDEYAAHFKKELHTIHEDMRDDPMFKTAEDEIHRRTSAYEKYLRGQRKFKNNKNEEELQKRLAKFRKKTEKNVWGLFARDYHKKAGKPGEGYYDRHEGIRKAVDKRNGRLFTAVKKMFSKEEKTPQQSPSPTLPQNNSSTPPQPTPVTPTNQASTQQKAHLKTSTPNQTAQSSQSNKTPPTSPQPTTPSPPQYVTPTAQPVTNAINWANQQAPSWTHPSPTSTKKHRRNPLANNPASRALKPAINLATTAISSFGLYPKIIIGLVIFFIVLVIMIIMKLTGAGTPTADEATLTVSNNQTVTTGGLTVSIEGSPAKIPLDGKPHDIQFSITVNFSGSGTANIVVSNPVPYPKSIKFKSATDGGVDKNDIVEWNFNLDQNASKTVTVTFHVLAHPPDNFTQIDDTATAVSVNGNVSSGTSTDQTDWDTKPTDNMCKPPYPRTAPSFDGGAEIPASQIGGHNFGDPNCNYSYNDLLALMKKLDPTNWAVFRTIVIAENGHAIPNRPEGPNAWNPGSTSTTSNCGSLGAFGLYQMDARGHCNNGPYDIGDVPWQRQTDNAIKYEQWYEQNTSKKWCYWANDGVPTVGC